MVTETDPICFICRLPITAGCTHFNSAFMEVFGVRVTEHVAAQSGHLARDGAIVADGETGFRAADWQIET